MPSVASYNPLGHSSFKPSPSPSKSSQGSPITSLLQKASPKTSKALVSFFSKKNRDFTKRSLSKILDGSALSKTQKKKIVAHFDQINSKSKTVIADQTQSSSSYISSFYDYSAKAVHYAYASVFGGTQDSAGKDDGATPTTVGEPVSKPEVSKDDGSTPATVGEPLSARHKRKESSPALTTLVDASKSLFASSKIAREPKDSFTNS